MDMPSINEAMTWGDRGQHAVMLANATSHAFGKT